MSLNSGKVLIMKKILLAVAMSSVMITGAHAAEDQGHGKITFKGSVIDAPCSIDADSLDQTVQLGSIAKGALEGGNRSTPVDFSIQLHDCSFDTKNEVNVAFNGYEGDKTAGLDNSFAVTGQAQGVGVTITDMGSNVIAPNTSAKAIVLNDGDNELQFQAYVQGASTSGAVVPGTFTSTANFVMSYE
jgi:type 1 fimbria pilin